MMAMIWSWAFGDETEADLESIGFDLVFLSAGGSAAWSAESTAVDPLNAYTYAGSPTRYSLGCDVGNTIGAGRVTLPSVSHPSTPQGIVTLAYRTTDAAVFDDDNRLIEIQTGNTANAAFVRPTSAGSNTLSLYLDNAFKGTSGAINANNWNYIALVFDLTTATYSGSFYVNGVLQGSGTTSIFVTPQGISSIRFLTTQQGSGLGATSLFGQVITYDDPVGDLADAVSPDNFVTRIVPNADGAGTVGTWTPTGAANNWQAVNPPINNATYAGITAPAPLDRLEVDTANATDLQTLLGFPTGIKPSPTIKGATVHSVSLATAGTAKIGIQEGGSELLAPADSVQSNDTYIIQSFPNNPSGSTQATGGVSIVGAVTGGDTLTINGTSLTAVSGARTPGSDDFSIASGTATGIRDDLLDAINDSLNSFTEVVEGVATSTTQITLTATANYSGTAGNAITLATSSSGINVSGTTFSGGTDSAWVGADQPVLVYEIDTV